MKNIDGQMSIFDFDEAKPIEKQSAWKKEMDTGSLVLECNLCESRVTAVNYALAVGTYGYRFCPYCGARIMNAIDFENAAKRIRWPGSLADLFLEEENVRSEY